MVDAIEISSYINDCTELKVDLDLLIHDLQFTQPTRYAIDFSEIRAFCRPDLARGFHLFRDDAPADRKELEQVALRRIFRAAESAPLLLLAPYIVELEGYVEDLRQQRVADIAASVVTAMEQLTTIVSAPGFRALEAFARGTEPTNYTAADAIRFLEINAGALVGLLNKTHTDPLQRLNWLFSSKLVVKFSKAVKASIELDGRSLAEWFDRLTDVRRTRPVADETNRLDAIAMSIVSAYNEQAETEPFRVALITRSGSMHEVAEALGHRKALRHPRTFVAFAELDEPEPELRRRELGTMRDSLDAFLSVVQGQAHDLAPAVSAAVGERLTAIKREWHAAARLGLSYGKLEPVQGDSDIQTRVADVLRILRDRESFQQVVQLRVRELSDEIERNHHLLALLLQDSAESDQAIGGQISVDITGATINLSAAQAMPYALEFYSPSARQWLETFEKHRRISWGQLLEGIARTSDAGAEYESVLAVAYLFAVMNRWAIAEKYAQISSLYGSDIEFTHEARFLLALCLRKRIPSHERYYAAYDLLNDALDSKRARLHDYTYDDPRFLKEQATLILVWNRHCKESGEEERIGRGVPSAEEALMLFERALQHPHADLSLRRQILNNILYELVVDVARIDEVAIRRYLGELYSLMGNVPLCDWSPRIRHTTVIAEWRLLQAGASLTPATDLVAALDEVLRSRDLTRLDRLQIERDRAEIWDSLLYG